MRRGRFGLLFGGYTLEGIGYIVAGTFLVAALAQQSPGRLGGAAWLVVGLAVIPSAATWDRATAAWSRPALLTVALLLQAVGIAPACTGSTAAALLGAILFGGTFIGVSTLALAEGRMLGLPGAVAVLTAGYSVGQIIGPMMVIPLLHIGFRSALAAGAVTVLLAAVACAAIWVLDRQPHPGRVDTQVADIAGEGLDYRQHRFPVSPG
ncbi:YbfB/YjiJ family MFS transporter [Mycobacterium sp. C31M]